MANRSMFIHLFLCRLAWLRQSRGYVDFPPELLLDLYVLAFTDVFQSGAYTVAILTVPDLGVSLAIVVGTYRKRAWIRYLGAYAC